MTKLFSALSASVDGYITGRDPGMKGAVEAAKDAVDGRDVALMGGALVTEALQEGLLDAVVR